MILGVIEDTYVSFMELGRFGRFLLYILVIFFLNHDFRQNLTCGTKKLNQLHKKYFFEKSYTYVFPTPSMVSIEQLLAKLPNLKVGS